MPEERKIEMAPTGSVQINGALRGIVMPELAVILQELRDLRKVVDSMTTKPKATSKDK